MKNKSALSFTIKHLETGAFLFYMASKTKALSKKLKVKDENPYTHYFKRPLSNSPEGFYKEHPEGGNRYNTKTKSYSK